MARKVLAIIGTYRKGRVIDTAVSEVLRGAQDSGADTQTISLLDARIEFCTNCRTCTQEKEVGRRGKCVLHDDMAGILDAIDRADGLVLGAPTNFYNVNALTRRFMERLLPYAYWPWNAKMGPKLRVAKPTKKAVTVTATACPMPLARILTPGSCKALKIAASMMGARVVGSLHYGGVPRTPDSTLDEKGLRKAYRTGEYLVSRIS